jgi:plasmid replication initiation protein
MVPKRGVDMEISLEELKEVCGCEEKYDNSFSNFRMKVLDKAVKEINEKSIYRVKYDYVKKGRAICGIKFHMNLFYHKEKQ